MLLTSSHVLVAFAALATVDPAYRATTAAAPFPGPGPLGLAVAPDGTIYSVGSDGQLYVTTPASAGTAQAVGPIGNNPSGLALLGGKLYAARRGTSFNGDVVEISQTTGQPTGLALAIETGDQTTGLYCGPDGIAADNTSGSLFVTLACPPTENVPAGEGWVFRVAPSLPLPQLFGCKGASLLEAPHGITVGPTGAIFVQDKDRIIKMAGVAAGANAGQCATVVNQAGANGIALVGITDAGGAPLPPKFVFVTDTSGNIWKIQVDFGSGRRVIANGGISGTFALIGPDNCLYASQGTGVTKVTQANGSCADLGNAGEALPSISLFWTGSSPIVGTTVHDVTATLRNVNAPAGSARFTVRFDRIAGSANPGSTTETGTLQSPATTLTVATQYSGANAGTDTIVATVVIDGVTYTSNQITITWSPLQDTSAPRIQAHVDGPQGDPFSCETNDARYLDGQTRYACGWYTGPPTIRWTVTDPESGVDQSRTTCPDTTLTEPGPVAGTPITCTATNTFGFQSHATVYLNVAQKQPTVVFQSASYADGDKAGYVAGTYTNRPVTAVFACDGSYGVPFLSCTTPGGTQSPAATSSDASLPLLVTVTFSAEGTYSPVATVREQAGRSATATFGPIYVDTTPPTVTGTAISAGASYTAGSWTNQSVTVSFACSDAFSGVATCPGAQTLSTEGAGQTATGSGTDRAGNTGTGTFSPVNIDLTKPKITGATYTKADGTAYTPGTATNQTVTIHYTCADQPGLSGIKTCPADAVMSNASEGTQTPAPVTATDNAGNVSDAFQAQSVVIDKTAPAITATGTYAGTGTAYGGAWTNRNVTVTFSCSSDAVDCPVPVTITTDTPAAGTSVTGKAHDAAGNEATSNAVLVRIDKVAPTLEHTQTGNVVSVTSADDRSGVSTLYYEIRRKDGTVVESGTTSGSKTVVVTSEMRTFSYVVTDVAGNTLTGEFPLTIPTVLAITSATSVTTSTGGDVTVVATLTADGAPLAGQTVTVSLGGKTFTGITAADGTITGTVSLPPGTYTITGTFAGQGVYLSSSATGSVTVAPLATGLSCSLGPVVIGLPLTITGTLTNAAGQPLGGKTLTFVVGSLALTATPSSTGADGTQTARTEPLPAGTFEISVSYAGDGTYRSTSCLTSTNTITVDGYVGGFITAGSIVDTTGRGGFNVHGDASGAKGELQFRTNGGVDYHAHTIKSVGVSLDGTKGSFSGTLVDGRPFWAYVEDNGEPGRNVDRYLLWVGASYTPVISGDGTATDGNVQIHKPTAGGFTRPVSGTPRSVIVAFKDGVDPKTKTDALEMHGFTADNRYSAALRGFSGLLTDEQIAHMKADADVAFVGEDPTVSISATLVPLAAKEIIPAGVKRIGAATATQVHQASTTAVAVLDTGIDLKHTDLVSVSGKNCITTGATAQDDNGHGTHVAGTIGAKNNGTGAVGVAPGTKLYAVKVLNSSGSGSWSQVICGIDWVTANAATLNIKVANLSLGGAGTNDNNCGNTNSDALHQAICRSVAAGVTYVAAAGNGTTNIATTVPAAYPEVLTVSAMSDSDGAAGAKGRAPACATTEKDDSYALTSNYAVGSADFAHTISAPGVCIYSTWLSGTYKTLSGTSMAAPHVAATVALCIGSGTAGGPCNGLTPQQIAARVRADAQAAATTANGFAGDPTRPVSGRYYGYLVSASIY